MSRALALCCNTALNPEFGAEADDWRAGKPVRVVRSHKFRKNSIFAPKEGIRYDGIYKVVKYFPAIGRCGKLIWKYLMRRDDPEPAPWTREGLNKISPFNSENASGNRKPVKKKVVGFIEEMGKSFTLPLKKRSRNYIDYPFPDLDPAVGSADREIRSEFKAGTEDRLTILQQTVDSCEFNIKPNSNKESRQDSTQHQNHSILLHDHNYFILQRQPTPSLNITISSVISVNRDSSTHSTGNNYPCRPVDNDESNLDSCRSSLEKRIRGYEESCPDNALEELTDINARNDVGSESE